MDDIEELVVNLIIGFALFCIFGWAYTQLSKRSKLLKTTVGLN